MILYFVMIFASFGQNPAKIIGEGSFDERSGDLHLGGGSITRHSTALHTVLQICHPERDFFAFAKRSGDLLLGECFRGAFEL